MKHTGFLTRNLFFKALPLMLILLISSVLLSSCDVKVDTTDNSGFAIESIVGSLGKERADALRELAFDNNAETKSITYNDVSAEMTLEFENDRLFRVYYDFGDANDTALKFANELCGVVEQKYGASDTYETLPDHIKDLTLDSYLAGNVEQYKEYWIDTDIDFTEIRPDAEKLSKRIDLGVGIYRLPSARVYIGGIINSSNTTKLQ